MGAAGRLVPHIEDLVPRTQIVLRSAMTPQTPLHLQRLRLVHQRHLIDGAVTRVATKSLGHMDAVIEEDEIRDLIHTRPLQRLAGAVAGPYWFEQLGIGPDLRVAVHAGLRRRNSGKARGLNRRVAVAAINAEAGHVMLVAEWPRLRLADPRVCDIGGTLDRVSDPS